MRNVLSGGRFLAAILAVVAVGSLAQADLIVNGSFENTSLSVANPPGWLNVPLGSTAINGWTVTSGDIDLIDGLWQAQDGTRSIDLSGWTAGTLTLSQNLATTPGQTYMLSFWLAGNPFSDTPRTVIKDLTVDIGGTSHAFSFDTTGKGATNMGWTRETLKFTALSGSTVLSFISGTNSNGGPALDMVSVTPVPAPGAIALGMFGLGLVGWIKRRFA